MVDTVTLGHGEYTSPEQHSPHRILILAASQDSHAAPNEETLLETIASIWPNTRTERRDLSRETTGRVRTLLRAAPHPAPQSPARGAPRAVPRRLFTSTTQRLLGAGLGPVIGPLIDRAAPDLILSTHPALTAGLAWLQHARGLAVPIGWCHDADNVHTPSGVHLPKAGLAAGLRTLHSRTAPEPQRPLRPEDALFLHVDTATVPQQVGTVLVFAPCASTPSPTRDEAAHMLAAVPGISGRLHRARTLRRARWTPDHRNTPLRLVDEADLTDSGQDLDAAVDEFFSVPLPTTAPGQARVVTGLPDGGRAILVKLHHALGDGITVLRALLSGSDGAHRSWATPPVTPVGRTPRPGVRRLAVGLWNLARAGSAPAYPTAGPITTALRHHQRMSLPGGTINEIAKSLEISSSELLHSLFVDAAHRTFPTPNGSIGKLRMMIPWSLRGTASVRVAGNSAGVLATDLPVGPMSPTRRARRVSSALREYSAGGTPEVAGAVVRTLGFLPPPLHKLAARLVYRSTWFNTIGTVLPGPRWDVRVNDVPLTMAYPVLPLAPGVGITWGAMTWGTNIALCITGSREHAHHVDLLCSRLRESFDELATTVSGPHEAPCATPT